MGVGVITEADTCREFVTPRLVEAGWGVAPAIRRSVEFGIATRYREVGARSIGKGLFVKPDFDGADTTWQKSGLIGSGDLIVSNIKA